MSVRARAGVAGVNTFAPYPWSPPPATSARMIERTSKCRWPEAFPVTPATIL
jgi:hypothetical protein